MHADIKGALEQINTSHKAFYHRGSRMTKEQVKKVLEYGLKKGYKSTSEFTDDEVDLILKGYCDKEQIGILQNRINDCDCFGADISGIHDKDCHNNRF